LKKKGRKGSAAKHERITVNEWLVSFHSTAARFHLERVLRLSRGRKTEGSLGLKCKESRGIQSVLAQIKLIYHSEFSDISGKAQRTDTEEKFLDIPDDFSVFRVLMMLPKADLRFEEVKEIWLKL
jgi:hypothetical protein